MSLEPINNKFVNNNLSYFVAGICVCVITKILYDKLKPLIQRYLQNFQPSSPQSHNIIISSSNPASTNTNNPQPFLPTTPALTEEETEGEEEEKNNDQPPTCHNINNITEEISRLCRCTESNNIETAIQGQRIQEVIDLFNSIRVKIARGMFNERENIDKTVCCIYRLFQYGNIVGKFGNQPLFNASVRLLHPLLKKQPDTSYYTPRTFYNPYRWYTFLSKRLKTLNNNCYNLRFDFEPTIKNMIISFVKGQYNNKKNEGIIKRTNMLPVIIGSQQLSLEEKNWACMQYFNYYQIKQNKDFFNEFSLDKPITNDFFSILTLKNLVILNNKILNWFENDLKVKKSLEMNLVATFIKKICTQIENMNIQQNMKSKIDESLNLIRQVFNTELPSLTVFANKEIESATTKLQNVL